MRCPVLCDAGTEVAHAWYHSGGAYRGSGRVVCILRHGREVNYVSSSIRLRACYAMSGTDIA
eukprot:3330426-Rhodomonas_salina.4